ncbi:hypothetical protein ACFQYP_01975 [Nonomuraea antimicrobica]
MYDRLTRLRAALDGRHLSDRELEAYGMARDAEGDYSVSRPGLHDFKTPQQGAATSVWCAASTALDGLGGVYCVDCDIAEIVTPGVPGRTGVASHACDPALAKRLWQLSEDLTGAALPAS